MIELNQNRLVWKTLCVILIKYRLAIENICCILVLSKNNKKKCLTDPIPLLRILSLLVYCCRYWDPHHLLLTIFSKDNTSDCNCCSDTFCVYEIEFHFKIKKISVWYCSALPEYPGFSGLQENQKWDSLALWLGFGLDCNTRISNSSTGNAYSARGLCLKHPEASISACCSNFRSLGENCRISHLE